jgi:hypothetical protein
VAGATIYVLINGLYIEFYDDFGVRPEDVGLDRLAILGRSAWSRLSDRPGRAVGYISAMASAETRLRADRPRPEADSTRGGRPLSEQQLLPRLVATPISLAIASLLVAGLVISTLGRFERAIENEVDRVRQGETVNGISLLMPFVDVRAIRTEVTWLGDKQRGANDTSVPPPLIPRPGRRSHCLHGMRPHHGRNPHRRGAIDLLDRGTGDARRSPTTRAPPV